MFKLKLALIVIMATSALFSVHVKAQDSSEDIMPLNDSNIIPPQSPTNNAPTIIDESDSSSVPEVDDYDG